MKVSTHKAGFPVNNTRGRKGNDGPDDVKDEFDNRRVDHGPDSVYDEFDNSRGRGVDPGVSWGGGYDSYDGGGYNGI